MRLFLLVLFILTLVTLTLAPPALATDGVFEINQTCALSTGCLVGDTAGFPVTVTTAGTSVRLTGTLTVSDENTTAIQINADGVTVDLNGFSIVGTTICSGTPVTSCAPTGVGDGINGLGSTGLAVLNGTIRKMGQDGIATSNGARIAGVRTLSNGRYGVRADFGSVVESVIAIGNGLDGIFSDLSTIRDSVSRHNGRFGINAFTSTVLGNTMTANGSAGLQVGEATGYGNNQISLNSGGNGNAQILFDETGFEIAPNICGADLTCP
jgi:hypothetical protein